MTIQTFQNHFILKFLLLTLVIGHRKVPIKEKADIHECKQMLVIILEKNSKESRIIQSHLVFGP
jgi:hypothetical protein